MPDTVRLRGGVYSLASGGFLRDGVEHWDGPEPGVNVGFGVRPARRGEIPVDKGELLDEKSCAPGCELPGVSEADGRLLRNIPERRKLLLRVGLRPAGLLHRTVFLRYVPAIHTGFYHRDLYDLLAMALGRVVVHPGTVGLRPGVRDHIPVVELGYLAGEINDLLVAPGDCRRCERAETESPRPGELVDQYELITGEVTVRRDGRGERRHGFDLGHRDGTSGDHLGKGDVVGEL